PGPSPKAKRAKHSPAQNSRSHSAARHRLAPERRIARRKSYAVPMPAPSSRESPACTSCSVSGLSISAEKPAPEAGYGPLVLIAEHEHPALDRELARVHAQLADVQALAQDGQPALGRAEFYPVLVKPANLFHARHRQPGPLLNDPPVRLRGGHRLFRVAHAVTLLSSPVYADRPGENARLLGAFAEALDSLKICVMLTPEVVACAGRGCCCSYPPWRSWQPRISAGSAR